MAVKGSAQADPKAWSTSYFATCSVEIIEGSGYRLGSYCIAITVIFLSSFFLLVTYYCVADFAHDHPFHPGHEEVLLPESAAKDGAVGHGTGKFSLGQKVDCNFHNSGQHYPGVVVAVNANGDYCTYNIKYEDGDEEDNVHENMIVAIGGADAGSSLIQAAENRKIVKAKSLSHLHQSCFQHIWVNTKQSCGYVWHSYCCCLHLFSTKTFGFILMINELFWIASFWIGGLVSIFACTADTYVVHPYNCQIPADSPNSTKPSWYYGDYHLVPNLGACPAKQLQYPVHYENCYDFRNKGFWENLDKANKAAGTATNLQGGADSWLMATNCMIFAVLFAAFLLPIGSSLLMYFKQNPVLPIFCCLFMSWVLWIGALGTLTQTDQINPRSWQASYFPNCDVDVKIGSGFSAGAYTVIMASFAFLSGIFYFIWYCVKDFNEEEIYHPGFDVEVAEDNGATQFTAEELAARKKAKSISHFNDTCMGQCVGCFRYVWNFFFACFPLSEDCCDHYGSSSRGASGNLQLPPSESKTQEPMNGGESISRGSYGGSMYPPVPQEISRPPNTHEPTLLNQGDRVEAAYRAGSKYYPGVIAGEGEVPGTYDINYDDGETERGLGAEFIRRPNKGATSSAAGRAAGSATGSATGRAAGNSAEYLSPLNLADGSVDASYSPPSPANGPILRVQFVLPVGYAYGVSINIYSVESSGEETIRESLVSESQMSETSCMEEAYPEQVG